LAFDDEISSPIYEMQLTKAPSNHPHHRARSLLPKERAQGAKSCINVDDGRKCISVGLNRRFTFDHTFDASSSQVPRSRAWASTQPSSIGLNQLLCTQHSSGRPGCGLRRKHLARIPRTHAAAHAVSIISKNLQPSMVWCRMMSTTAASQGWLKAAFKATMQPSWRTAKRGQVSPCIPMQCQQLGPAAERRNGHRREDVHHGHFQSWRR
jgi:hypothetical protein